MENVQRKTTYASGFKAEPPRVSYIVLTRNRCREVMGCLNNLLEQDYPEREFILVDNGSTDDTVQKVKDFFPGVRVISLGHNLGVPAGRNRGVEAALGEICIFIDDDARFMARDETRRVVTFFRNDEKTACVGFRIRDGRTGVENRKTIPRADKRIIEEDSPIAYFCGAGFAVRRDAFCDMGYFWEPLIYAGEELDLSYRLLNAGYRLVYAASVQVAHYEVATARPKGQWIFYQARNRCWVAVRNLPWHFVVPMTLLWWVYTGWVGLRHRELKFFIEGVRDALAGLPLAFRKRQSLGKHALLQIKKLSGRLWF